jgi:hypothetical protein
VSVPHGPARSQNPRPVANGATRDGAPSVFSRGLGIGAFQSPLPGRGCSFGMGSRGWKRGAIFGTPSGSGGLKPGLFPDRLRGSEGPLFHGGACVREFFRASKTGHSQSKFKINVKGDGQECPSHTIHPQVKIPAPSASSGQALSVHRTERQGRSTRLG